MLFKEIEMADKNETSIEREARKSFWRNLRKAFWEAVYKFAGKKVEQNKAVK